MERPIAPHGIEAHPRHAVVCAVVTAPRAARRKRKPDAPVGPFMDVLLLPAEQAARQCEEHGGYTREVAQRVTDDGLRLVFSSETPGRMGSLGRGQSLGATLYACEGGILLPGHPPPLPWRPGEAEAFAFAFLVGADGAIQHFPGWAAWARSEGIDTTALHRYVWNLPPAPPLEWFARTHTEADLRAARLLRWSGPPDEETWPGEHRLWLLRAEWVNDIPHGIELVSISGERVPSPEHRGGQASPGELVSR